MDNSAVFQTDAMKELTIPNIYTASFVYACGVRLVTVIVPKGERRSNSFVFDNSDNAAERAVAEYHEGGEIEAKALFEALRALKSELDAVRR
jgi:hypothetical protein